MKLHKEGYIKSVLTMDEVSSLKAALSRESTVQTLLLKLVNARLRAKHHVSMDDPNWALKQANYIGAVEELTFVKNILDGGDHAG